MKDVHSMMAYVVVIGIMFGIILLQN